MFNNRMVFQLSAIYGAWIEIQWILTGMFMGYSRGIWFNGWRKNINLLVEGARGWEIETCVKCNRPLLERFRKKGSLCKMTAHPQPPPGQGYRCASISRKSQIKRCITLEVLQGNIVLKDLSLSPDCRINVTVSPVRRCAPSRHFAFLYTIIRTVSEIKGTDHSVEVLFVLLAWHDHLSKHVYSKYRVWIWIDLLTGDCPRVIKQSNNASWEIPELNEVF